MAYTLNATLLLGSSQTGLTLKAALRDTAGTIHATLRDISAGFAEDGAGVYGWVSSSVPDGYRGRVVFYTGTLGAASDFTSVTVKTAANVSPEEYEYTGSVEANLNFQQFCRLVAGVLLGKVSGVAANAPVFRDVNDTKVRVSATTGPDGRITVVLDPT